MGHLLVARGWARTFEQVSAIRLNHQPKLMRRPDGRWEVQCRAACEERVDEALPLGIGVPITDRFEAESALRNHAGLAA